nr:unnamed protein product [Digitaria exilis]
MCCATIPSAPRATTLASRSQHGSGNGGNLLRVLCDTRAVVLLCWRSPQRTDARGAANLAHGGATGNANSTSQRDIIRRLSIHSSSNTNASINENKDLSKVEDCTDLDKNHLKDLGNLHLLRSSSTGSYIGTNTGSYIRTDTGSSTGSWIRTYTGSCICPDTSSNTCADICTKTGPCIRTDADSCICTDTGSSTSSWICTNTSSCIYTNSSSNTDAVICTKNSPCVRTYAGSSTSTDTCTNSGFGGTGTRTSSPRCVPQRLQESS